MKMNSSIHDIITIEISDLSADELVELEHKMQRSNKKLPAFIAQSLIIDSRHLPILDIIKASCENPKKNKNTTSSQKLLLDFLVAYYPNTEMISIKNLCRAFLCHDVAAYLESMLISFNEKQNFPDETFVANRFFPRFLSQPK